MQMFSSWIAHRKGGARSHPPVHPASVCMYKLYMCRLIHTNGNLAFSAGFLCSCAMATWVQFACAQGLHRQHTKRMEVRTEAFHCDSTPSAPPPKYSVYMN